MNKVMKKTVIGLALAAAVCVCGVGLLGRAKTAKAESALDVNAKAALLVDPGTGTVVYEKNADERLQIASMVKIMTLDLIFEEIESGTLSYETPVCASEYATGMGGSQAFLDTGSEYPAGELIKSIIVASANDSCVAMAEHIAGSVPAFVDRMNDKAARLGMSNTYFANCTGLPAPNQYSCARDVSVMMKELIGHKGFFDFSGIWMFDFKHPSGRVTQLSNTNKLVRFYNGCDGGKTGFTNEARSCLSATAKRGDTRFICVVMGADNSKLRNAEVSKLLDHGFANYESRKFCLAGDVIDERIAVEGGKSGDVGAIVSSDLALFGKKGELKDCAVETEIAKLRAPIAKGDIVGEVRIVRGGEVLARADLLADSDVAEKGFGDFVRDITEKW